VLRATNEWTGSRPLLAIAAQGIGRAGVSCALDPVAASASGFPDVVEEVMQMKSSQLFAQKIGMALAMNAGGGEGSADHKCHRGHRSSRLTPHGAYAARQTPE
jgi:hypothetical protein